MQDCRRVMVAGLLQLEIHLRLPSQGVNEADVACRGDRLLPARECELAGPCRRRCCNQQLGGHDSSADGHAELGSLCLSVKLFGYLVLLYTRTDRGSNLYSLFRLTF